MKTIPRLRLNKKGLLLFMRAQVSAQIATFVDFILSIFLNQWAEMYYVYATFIGTITGGMINCGINYKWTFRQTNSKLRYIVPKYILVWTGSILLNIGLTYLLTEWLMQQGLIACFDSVGRAFVSAKTVVSVFVALAWNYTLQKNFVFKRIIYKNNQ